MDIGSIVRVHNQYRAAGGEDTVFRSESDLLRIHGQSVQTIVVSNDNISLDGAAGKVKAAINSIWSVQSRNALRESLQNVKPNIVHFDNTFPLLSPAAYSAARNSGAAVVQTLHNYRLLCPSATFYRDGHVCEDCLRKTPPFPGVFHACYRQSHLQSSVVAAMLTTHRLIRTYTRHVDRYIALTEFARQKFIEGGLPAEKIVVKPNFVNAPTVERSGNGPHMLFVGRLSPEKGLRTLLAAQSKHDQEVRIAGDGPLSQVVTSTARTTTSLKPMGRLDSAAVRAQMLSARALVFPSEWYEGFPLTLAEAFAAGLPVITSRLGGMAEIVEDGVTGLHFEPGNADDLAAKIRWAAEHPEEVRRMGANARREHEKKYTPERNYEMLMDIYREAIESRRCS